MGSASADSEAELVGTLASWATLSSPHRAAGRAAAPAPRNSEGGTAFWRSVPNSVADGIGLHLYHPQGTAEQRPEAYLQLDAELESEPSAVPPQREVLRAFALQATERDRLPRLGQLSQAPTGRAPCRHWASKIDKNAWRIALQPIEEGRLQAWGFLHVGRAEGNAGVPVSEQRLDRYSALAGEALGALREALVEA